MSDEKPAREVANNQTDRNQSQSSKSPRIPTNGRNDNSQEASANTKHRATSKKHDALDWANLIVLVFTFLAACGAAFEAKRLADLTYELMVDGRRIADRQARLIAKSIKVSSDTMVSSARAWIVPKDPYIGATLGKPLFINLRYVNIGKEPALNLTPGQTEYTRLNTALLQNPPEAARAIGPNDI